MSSRFPKVPSREQSYRGYDHQSRHPCIRIAVELPLGSIRGVEEIDAWLLGPFAVPAERLRAGSSVPPDNSQDALAVAVIERALVLFGDLLRHSGVPCFESGRVLEMAPIAHRPQDWRAIVLQPVIDHVPARVFEKLFRDLLQLILTHFINEPTPELGRRIIGAVQETFVKRLQSALNFNSSTLPLCRLAFDRDIPFRHIGNGFFQFGTGAKSAITRGSAVVRDSALGAQICIYKQITADVLGAAGLPVAQHFVVDTRQAALAAAGELGWPVVVKPSNQERSEGVTVNITDERALVAAYDLASAKGGQTLVERQAPGVCHRVMVADGELVYTVIRYPKGVTGNGRETVAELVSGVNERSARLPPWKRLKDVPLDDAALRCIADQGLTLQSVPDAGRRVFVRPITSGEWGGDIENLTAQTHPENVRLAVTAARVLGLTVAGIDLMTEDVSRPWYENGGTIIEVNFDPQFAISQREEDAPRLLSAVVEGDGRIPVHLVSGEGDLLGHARKLRSELIRDDRPIHLTGAGHSEDPLGQEIVMMPATLFERSLALAMRPDVRELIVVGEPSDVFERGLAVDRLDSVHVVAGDAQRRDALAGELRERFRVV